MALSTDKDIKISRWSWYFYDCGNSAYASVVLLAVYSAFFKDIVIGGAQGTRLWGISVGIAAILVAIITPFLGTIADFTGSKKKFLMIFTSLSIFFTAMLFFVGAGDVFYGMFFFIMAEIGYRGAQVFYDSLLKDVSTPESIGYISGKGWAVGMIGGIVTLIAVLLQIRLFGDGSIRFAFLLTAAFYLIAAIPAFMWVIEKKQIKPLPDGDSSINIAFKTLRHTFRSIRHYREFIKYMIAFLIYNNGIMILMDFAAIIGATLFGMPQPQLIMFVILIHIAGTFGALLFGRISDKKSSKEAIILSLLILIVSITGLFFIRQILWFYAIGFLAGFSLTGAQAVSRSMVSQLAPASKTTEFYGFMAVAGRTSTFIGPVVFGTISYCANNWYLNKGYDVKLAEHNSLLWAIGAIVAFLLAGLLVLLNIKRVSARDPIRF